MSELGEWVESHKNNPDDELAVRNYMLNVDYMERQFEKAKTEGSVVVCQHCGYPEVPTARTNAKEMIENKCCFGCWYWLHHIGVANPKVNSVIVDGDHKMDAGFSKGRKDFLGFGGRVWYYKRKGDQTIHMTNNMWHQGQIPSRFKVEDNCVFCTKEEYDSQQKEKLESGCVMDRIWRSICKVRSELGDNCHISVHATHEAINELRVQAYKMGTVAFTVRTDVDPIHCEVFGYKIVPTPAHGFAIELHVRVCGNSQDPVVYAC